MVIIEVQITHYKQHFQSKQALKIHDSITHCTTVIFFGGGRERSDSEFRVKQSPPPQKKVTLNLFRNVDTYLPIEILG
jgi:hypothetical protein